MTVQVLYSGLYDYIPSKVAAIVFAGVFLLTTLVHFIQLIFRRTWFFIPFFLGGCLEVLGYLARAVSAKEYPNYKEGPVDIQAVLIIIAPSILSASIYMELGRIMIATNGEKFSIIRRSWLTKIFVCGDVMSFFVQLIGASMLLKTSTASTGSKVIKIGLVVQILFFALFVITSIIFHVRISKAISSNQHHIMYDVPWKRHQGVLYFSSILIFIRSVFRLIEFSMSSNTTLYKHEWWAYVFDAGLMALIMIAFNIVHPGAIKKVIREMKKNGSGKAESDVLLPSYPAQYYPIQGQPAAPYPARYEPTRPYPQTSYAPTNV